MSTAAPTATAGGTRRSISLGDAAREFARWASPRILAVAVLAALTARVVAGGWRTADLVVAAVMLGVQPLVEWLIHVFVLHMRPKPIGRWLFDTELAQKHRLHHADPRDRELVFIPTRPLLIATGVVLAIGLLAFPDRRLGLTYLLVTAAVTLVYEWTHYLVHTEYRPRTRLYRAIWRNHRLHHYKNENYWFTVTTAHTADRLLRTDPDATEVATSPTVRTLGATTETG